MSLLQHAEAQPVLTGDADVGVAAIGGDRARLAVLGAALIHATRPVHARRTRAAVRRRGAHAARVDAALAADQLAGLARRIRHARREVAAVRAGRALATRRRARRDVAIGAAARDPEVVLVTGVEVEDVARAAVRVRVALVFLQPADRAGRRARVAVVAATDGVRALLLASHVRGLVDLAGTTAA